MTIEWNKALELGISEIDKQHKQLVAIINELADAIKKGKSDQSICDITQRLIDYAAVHFSTEEKYFEEFDYEDSKNHIAEHDSFREKVHAYERCPDEKRRELACEMLDFLDNWLFKHLMEEDKKYVDCFKEHGL